MNLVKANLKEIDSSTFDIPNSSLFLLPEKVLQFGTGVLLRALPDYFIDKANKHGVFNGRIVIVKSTNQGDPDVFDLQDNLFTHFIRGVENGKVQEKNIINASISRVILANSNWNAVLACASIAEMQVIISNTTEVGIVYEEEDIRKSCPPKSFPAKLLAFLYARYEAFGGDKSKGMVVIPTELIPENGKLLRSIVKSLAEYNNLNKSFLSWLNNHNHFYNSLVDRIVPGKASSEMKQQMGIKDDLAIMSEVYALWAIEAPDYEAQKILSFAGVDRRVTISSDITDQKESSS